MRTPPREIDRHLWRCERSFPKAERRLTKSKRSFPQWESNNTAGIAMTRARRATIKKFAEPPEDVAERPKAVAERPKLPSQAPKAPQERPAAAHGQISAHPDERGSTRSKDLKLRKPDYSVGFTTIS